MRFGNSTGGGDWRPLNAAVKADFIPQPDPEFGHEQGRIRPHIKLFVDGVQARDPGAALPPGAELMVVGALSRG